MPYVWWKTPLIINIHEELEPIAPYVKEGPTIPLELKLRSFIFARKRQNEPAGK